MSLFPSNVVLFVPEGSTALTFDEFGNPVEGKASVGKYLLSLSSDNNQPILKNNPGQDTSVQTFTGRCVGKLLPDGSLDRGKYLPTEVCTGKTFPCEITDPASMQKQRGNFIVLSVFQSKYRVVTKVLGHKVNGYFEFGR